MPMETISSWREFDDAVAEAGARANGDGRAHSSLVFRGLARWTYSNRSSLARLGDDLWGVRLDTSETMVDRSLFGEMGDFRPTGVNPRLVHRVREALDLAGHRRVRIVVSGGFDAAKIRAFEDAGVPVDAYGVGSTLIRGENDFTADVVMTDGRPAGKRGRELLPNPRLELVR